MRPDPKTDDRSPCGHRSAASRPRAGGANPRRAGILGAPLRPFPRDPGAAAGHRDVGRDRPPPGSGPNGALARSRSRHRLRLSPRRAPARTARGHRARRRPVVRGARDRARPMRARNEVGARAAFVASDWARPSRAAFDLIVSNPPYIPSAVIAASTPDVREHDPPACPRRRAGRPRRLSDHSRRSAAAPRRPRASGPRDRLRSGRGDCPASRGPWALKFWSLRPIYQDILDACPHVRAIGS